MGNALLITNPAKFQCDKYNLIIMPLQLPTWSQTKTTSKQGFDKAWGALDKLGAPVNALSNKIGSEAFWPTTLDKESDKAARILRSFCKDGFYVEEEGHIPSKDVPKGKVKVIKKIPTKVIREAKGLAIFTTMRTGLWVSGAGGSGILVARTATGEWSPPSGIMLHTAGLGFLIGVDIYDCVIVINSEKALQAFTKIRCTLGGEVSAVAGPVGIGGVLETEIHKRQAPVWTYLKSRGFYAGVQVDGTVIIERTDENERFYGERIGVTDILAGKVRHPPYGLRTLMATIKAAQGDNDVDVNALPPSEPTPGDMEVVDSTGFGLPPAETDPDPFGVKALEQQGMEIREAGTKSRPSMEAFEYKPSPTSPIFNTFGRRHSVDSRRDSKRDSGRLSIASTDRGTQTVIAGPLNADESPGNSRTSSPIKKTTQNLAEEEDEEASDIGSSRYATDPSEINRAITPPNPIVSKARLVTIPKRIPPALPPRNPYRSITPLVPNAEMPSNTTLEEDSTTTNPESPLREIPNPSGTYPVPLSPSHESHNMHLTPRANHTNFPQDPYHLSSSFPGNKDGFDEISMSGSDYSHTQDNNAPISMTDHESVLDGNKENTGLGIAIATEPEKGSEDILHVSTGKDGSKDEEFHSVPSTPVEGGAHMVMGHGVGWEGKEDFS